MELRDTLKKVKNYKIISDIYNGNNFCQCGERLTLENLQFCDLGHSLRCKCGIKYFLISGIDRFEEIIVDTKYGYGHNGRFIIRKLMTYITIDSENKAYIPESIREESEYLIIKANSNYLSNLTEVGIQYYNDNLEVTPTIKDKFFDSFTMNDLKFMGESFKKICDEKNIKPNYGEIVKSFTNNYNNMKYEEFLRAIFGEYIVEAFYNCGLEYLLDYNLAQRINTIEKSIFINKKATTPSEILEIPQGVIDLISKNKWNLSYINEIQKFIKYNSYESFKILIENNYDLFNIESLNNISRLLEYGYKASKLVTYVEEIIKDENLESKDIIQYLVDSISMSRRMEIDFSYYGKNLKKRHDKIVENYSIVIDEINNKKIKLIKDNLVIKQYGNEYVTIIPENIEQIKNEGIKQKNCVLSYVSKIGLDETIILFIRKSDNLNESYITLEITKNKMCQAKRALNKSIDIKDKRYLYNLAILNNWEYRL